MLRNESWAFPLWKSVCGLWRSPKDDESELVWCLRGVLKLDRIIFHSRDIHPVLAEIDSVAFAKALLDSRGFFIYFFDKLVFLLPGKVEVSI
jgi:hypothetical protein